MTTETELLERETTLENGHLAKEAPPSGEVVEQRVQTLPPARSEGGDPLLRMLEAALTKPDLDVEKLERLYELYTKSQDEQARIAYEAAKPGMQAELPVIDAKGKIKVKGTLRSKYGLWEDIRPAIMPILARHGFGLDHRVERTADREVTITCIMSHENGHTKETSLPLVYDNSGEKNAVQEVGSSISYGKRYTSELLVGYVIKDDKTDDDGEGANKPPVITDVQQEELKKLCVDAAMEMSKFCNHLQINGFHEIPASKYKNAKGLLEARIVKIKADAKRAEIEQEKVAS